MTANQPSTAARVGGIIGGLLQMSVTTWAAFETTGVLRILLAAIVVLFVVSNFLLAQSKATR